MHILIIPSERFVPDDEPGAGIFQYHQARIIADAGHKVGVVSISQSFTVLMIVKAFLFRLLGRKTTNKCNDYSIVGLGRLLFDKIYNVKKFIVEYTKDNMPVVSINGFYYSRDNEVAKTNGWVKAGMVACEEYFNQHGRPDVVHAHNVLSAGLLAKSLYEKYKILYVITEHSSDWTRGKIEQKELIAQSKLAYLNSAGSFAVSSDFKQKLNSLMNFDKIAVLPNVIDPFLEQKKIVVSNVVNEQFVFLHIGEFRIIKDQKTLLKAFANVVEVSSNVILRIGGTGRLEDELKLLAHELGVEDKVVFLGYLNREQVYKEMASCNCFVMSSLYETFCVVLIEAMLFGKPVVACKSGGPIDIVQDKVGYLVDVETPESLSKGMLDVMTNIDSFAPSDIREYVIAKYGAGKFIKDIDKIYKEAVYA